MTAPAIRCSEQQAERELDDLQKEIDALSEILRTVKAAEEALVVAVAVAQFKGDLAGVQYSDRLASLRDAKRQIADGVREITENIDELLTAKRDEYEALDEIVNPPEDPRREHGTYWNYVRMA